MKIKTYKLNIYNSITGGVYSIGTITSDEFETISGKKFGKISFSFAHTHERNISTSLLKKTLDKRLISLLKIPLRIKYHKGLYTLVNGVDIFLDAEERK